ncbi:EamA/RhaT family transporter [Streptomyces sp. NPDC050560]|uniref:EamA/RhaT family transporter n=1 Tax=Streptomyces sp. NPDC050560 TaxID=3365630 RepID=UPI00378D10B4
MGDRGVAEDRAAAEGAGAAAGAGGAAGAADGGGPAPEPLRFFGTTWLHHDRGYALRRVGVALGSLAGAAAGCLLLTFAYDGLVVPGGPGYLGALMVGAFTVCGALALHHTWRGFTRRPEPAGPRSPRGFLGLGFVGVLLAYFLRSFAEAPGEGLHRAAYEAARQRRERRTGRGGAGRARGGKRG